MRVLLDTNALMIPGQFGIDIYDELTRLFGKYEPITISDVVRELERIAMGHGRDASAARMGLQLVTRCTIVESNRMPGSVDEKIVSVAEELRSIVVTNDRMLRDTLIRRGMGVVSMRGQKKLEIMQGC